MKLFDLCFGFGILMVVVSIVLSCAKTYGWAIGLFIGLSFLLLAVLALFHDKFKKQK